MRKTVERKFCCMDCCSLGRDRRLSLQSCNVVLYVQKQFGKCCRVNFISLLPRDTQWLSINNPLEAESYCKVFTAPGLFPDIWEPEFFN